ncbi:MAG: hypothetical protein FWB74_00255 [Defluviitaleaceae bacterium]|nr:hypothetical protein [Defluviitaleaceae bacterium]
MLAELLIEQDPIKVNKYVQDMGFKDGDMFELVEMGGKMRLFPLVDCSDEAVAKIEAMIEERKPEGSRTTYKSMEDLIAALHVEVEDD